MSSFLPFVAHLFFFLFWTYFHYVEFYVIDFPDYGDSGKPCFLCRLRYLTVWSTVSQHVYFLIALFCDLFYTSDTSKEGNRPLLLSLRDFVFTTATCSFGLVSQSIKQTHLHDPHCFPCSLSLLSSGLSTRSTGTTFIQNFLTD
eukprot:m.10711 g.10711  ORF g.10711 m.10711 type:complete len:144 (+) comp22586_c0_seq1:266-697(+)